MKRTKIICTIGPASDSKPKLKKLMRAGMDIARLNFSHGTYGYHKKTLQNVRQAAKEIGKNVAVIQDLQGPKIRVGKIKESGIEIRKNDTVYFESSKIERKGLIPINYSGFHKLVKPGIDILLDDGLIKLTVVSVSGKKVKCKAIYGGKLLSNKGVNLPNIKVKIPSLTKKDIENLEFGIKNDVDYVALSFVQDANDIISLQKKIKQLQKQYKYNKKGLPCCKIIAKIEKPQAINNIDEIIRVSDAIMVARGDLGIETSPKNIPIFQKTIINKCNDLARPVIVATQMLDSMTEKPLPTRAEVSDVANAVIDHTDAVMLSGETAVGKYPVETVQLMSDTTIQTEESPYDDLMIDDTEPMGHSFSLSYVAANLARKIKVAGIVVTTFSGLSAQVISRYRPELPIIALVPHDKIMRQLALSWGVQSYKIPQCKDLNALMNSSLSFIRKKKMFKKGDKVIMVTGQPTGKSGTTNLLKIIDI